VLGMVIGRSPSAGLQRQTLIAAPHFFAGLKFFLLFFEEATG